MSYPSGPPPWDELDPGILSTVELLWSWGFHPVDSGDGAHKFCNGTAGTQLAFPYPHVVMRCDPKLLVAEADRLYRGVKLNADRWLEPPRVQVSYDVESREATITFYGRLS